MNNKSGLRWNVFGSNAEAIEARAIEVGVLGLNSTARGGFDEVCVVQMLEL